MPLYTYICKSDHLTDYVYSVHAKRPARKRCPECGANSRRLFVRPQLVTMQPYTTMDGDGIPTEIRTPEQERAYEQKHGIYHATSSDLSRMRDELPNCKKNRRKREEAKWEPINQAYERAESKVATMGAEYVKELKDTERKAAEV